MLIVIRCQVTKSALGIEKMLLFLSRQMHMTLPVHSAQIAFHSQMPVTAFLSMCNPWDSVRSACLQWLSKGICLKYMPIGTFFVKGRHHPFMQGSC